MKETKTVLPDGIEYVDLASGAVRPMVVTIYGPPGGGKTRFGITAPGDIAILPTHRKVLPTAIDIARKLGKKLVKPVETFERTTNPLWLAVAKGDCGQTVVLNLDAAGPKCCTKHYSRHLTDRMKRAALRMHAMPNVRTVMIDSATHLYEDVTFACYGRDEAIIPRDRKIANRELREFYEMLGSKNLILTHEWKQVWRNEKPTTAFEMAGWKGTGYFASVELEVTGGSESSIEDADYQLNVKRCQENAALVGKEGLLVNEGITFGNVAAAIWPDVDPEVWE